MIYFSDLKGKRVLTEDNVDIGKCEDIIFLAEDHPTLTKLVIRDKKGKKIITPFTFLNSITTHITIEKKYEETVLEENELHIVKNLLDKQIIDLKGNKVVRVNDVIIQDKPTFYIAGVDIGFISIIRWFRIERLLLNFMRIVGIHLQPNFLSWGDIQPLELVRGQVKLRKQEEKLEKIRPSDLAACLEKTNVQNARKFLRVLDQKRAAQVIVNLNAAYQATLFRNFKPERAALFISLFEPDDAVDILLTLPSKKREEVLAYCQEKKRRELFHLLKLSNTPIGALITTEFITASAASTVREVVDRIKKETTQFQFLSTVYVVNEEGELVGVFNLHELLLQDLDTPLYKFFIQNVIVAHLTTPRELVFKKMLINKLQTLPVIDEKKHILGIVTIDDVSR